MSSSIFRMRRNYIERLRAKRAAGDSYGVHQMHLAFTTLYLNSYARIITYAIELLFAALKTAVSIALIRMATGVSGACMMYLLSKDPCLQVLTHRLVATLPMAPVKGLLVLNEQL